MRRPPKKYMKAEKTCAEMEDDADVVPHFHHVPLWTKSTSNVWTNRLHMDFLLMMDELSFLLIKYCLHRVLDYFTNIMIVVDFGLRGGYEASSRVNSCLSLYNILLFYYISWFNIRIIGDFLICMGTILLSNMDILVG
jgi:hypothetical protein